MKRFRQFDHLRSFVVVAEHLNLGEAARELNLSKGAVSHQIRRLEDELGFALFSRARKRLALTREGEQLLPLGRHLFSGVERAIDELRVAGQSRVTIGMATYFASRWLSPRLMHFLSDHGDIGLRIQPLVDLTDLRREGLDLAIRWGKGGWRDPDYVFERIFRCPALLTASAATGRRIEAEGIESVLAGQTLLHDQHGSDAWRDWFDVAGLDMNTGADNLVIPDPNVRVQAVIDGQGVALNDRLVDDEVAAGRLYQYRDVTLDDYGYYLVWPSALDGDSAIGQFRDWIMQEARNEQAALTVR